MHKGLRETFKNKLKRQCFVNFFIKTFNEAFENIKNSESKSFLQDGDPRKMPVSKHLKRSALFLIPHWNLDIYSIRNFPYLPKDKVKTDSLENDITEQT